MRKIPDSMQKVFNFARANGRTNIYQIAKALELDYKNVHTAVKRCEELGFLTCELVQSPNRSVKLVSVRPGLADLKIETVFMESGSRLLERKESRRKAYFERHGSMSLPESGQSVIQQNAVNPVPSISLRRKPFVA